MIFKIPQHSSDPHPTGRHTGTIVNVQDEGVHESTWDGKTQSQHKISIRIDSDSAFMESGEPFFIIQWFTLSGSPRSNLRKFREAVLDRPLTREEETNFDPESELIRKRISYRVDHKERQDGSLRPVIREGSVEPADEESRPDDEDETGTLKDGEEPVPVSGGNPNGKAPTEDDLPF